MNSCFVIFQSLLTTPVVPAHLVTGAVGLDPPFSAPQALRGPFLGLLCLVSVNLVQEELSAQTLRLQESPMWRGYHAEPPTSAP